MTTYMSGAVARGIIALQADVARYNAHMTGVLTRRHQALGRRTTDVEHLHMDEEGGERGGEGLVLDGALGAGGVVAAGGALAGVIAKVGIDVLENVGKAVLDHFKSWHHESSKPLPKTFKLKQVGQFVCKVVTYVAPIILLITFVWGNTHSNSNSQFTVQISMAGLTILGTYFHNSLAESITNDVLHQANVQTMADTMTACYPDLLSKANEDLATGVPIPTIAADIINGQKEEGWLSWGVKQVCCCCGWFKGGRNNNNVQAQEMEEV